LLRAAVLSNTAAKIGTEASWRDRIATVRKGGIEAIADGVLEKWFTARFRAEEPDALALWRHMLTRTPVGGYCGCCAALSGTDLHASNAGLRLPVLAVVGDADGSTPPDLVRETAAGIPGARFEIIRGAGHIPCVEQPAALATLLGAFLKELDLV
jgi:3-oxoadipate enol-lactonase